MYTFLYYSGSTLCHNIQHKSSSHNKMIPMQAKAILPSTNIRECKHIYYINHYLCNHFILWWWNYLLFSEFSIMIIWQKVWITPIKKNKGQVKKIKRIWMEIDTFRTTQNHLHVYGNIIYTACNKNSLMNRNFPQHI